MESEDKKFGEEHKSESESNEESIVAGVGAGRNGGNKSDSDEESAVVGVGAGRKGKNKKSSSSSSSSKKNKSPAKASTKRFTKEDEEWAKDLPSDFTTNCKDWFQYLSGAIKQGKLSVCWAVAIARCVQASFAIRGIKVELSPQHLINNITGKSKEGDIIKFEELSDFLKNQGLVLEEVCKFSGSIKATCPKECSKQTSDDSFYKIKEFNVITKKDVKEEDLLKLVYQRPIVGEHYWLIQNSYGEAWGEKGIGKIIRKCSLKNGESSLFVGAIDIVICMKPSSTSARSGGEREKVIDSRK
ncbi:unnamed protein product [Arabidopsis thaliana]|uniref:Peptidase C1A papain C-terminal domain-containing protein n=1 Tax=Arabidopsis thaliana TaxID=3702 RepID=A0A5S9Y1U5_ARATH|nr:unnamed protein product [Arabidopsis thaliana]